ncbi:MAG: glycosyltransferase family 4 protein [Myxococcales bacterium]
MRIGFDLTSTAVARLSGTSLYALALVQALAQTVPEHRYVGCFRLSAVRRRGRMPTLPAGVERRYYWDRFDPLLDRAIDVFHGLDSRAGRFGRVKQVVTLHDVVHLWRTDFGTPEGRAKRRVQFEEVKRRASAILTVSQFEKSRIVEHLGADPARIHVIPLAPAPEFRPVREPDVQVLERRGVRGPYVLFVGVIQQRKNVLRLMEAFSRVKTDATLVLAGSVRGLFEAEFRAALRRHGERVQWLGYVPNEELPALYAGARCLAFPSEYESFGIPVLEAMSCGCPVVASTAGALPETCGGAAELHEPTDVEGMAAALDRVLNDESHRLALRDRGLRHAAQFSYERVARETAAVYAGL